MFAQTWIESLNMIFGTETVESGIIVSLLTLICLTVAVVVAASENKRLMEIVIVTDFLGSLTLTYFKWLPTFTGLVIALVFALLGAWILTGGNSNG